MSYAGAVDEMINPHVSGAGRFIARERMLLRPYFQVGAAANERRPGWPEPATFPESVGKIKKKAV
jgi:hypothetical protein